MEYHPNFCEELALPIEHVVLHRAYECVRGRRLSAFVLGVIFSHMSWELKLLLKSSNLELKREKVPNSAKNK